MWREIRTRGDNTLHRDYTAECSARIRWKVSAAMRSLIVAEAHLNFCPQIDFSKVLRFTP